MSSSFVDAAATSAVATDHLLTSCFRYCWLLHDGRPSGQETPQVILIMNYSHSNLFKASNGEKSSENGRE